MSLVRALAAGRVATLPRIGGFEPIGNIGGGCHAGAGHEQGNPRGVFGDLCDACFAATARLLSALLRKPTP